MLNKIKKLVNRRLFRSMKDGEITYEEMLEKLKNGAILLDVRSIQEYNEGHLNGAIQIDDYKLSSKAGDILKNKDEEIIVYCQNGGRSKRAYNDLKKLGYLNVYNLYGGLENI